MEITGRRYAGTEWRKLLSTRRGTAIVALVCTLIAAGIIVFAMHRYRASVDASGQPETVLVATQLIQKGTTGQAIANGNLFHPTQIVAKQVSAGAISDTAAIANRVATVNIYPGQQLTLSDFAASGDLATQLGPADRAVSVPLAQGPGLIPQLQVGDHVDVYGGFEWQTPAGRTAPFVKLLVANAVVLKSGTTGSGGIGSANNVTTPTSNVILKVGVGDASKVTFASSYGVIWLMLRGPNATRPSASQLTSIDSLLFGRTGTGR